MHLESKDSLRDRLGHVHKTRVPTCYWKNENTIVKLKFFFTLKEKGLCDVIPSENCETNIRNS